MGKSTPEERRQQQAKRAVIELFGGWALEAIPLNWVVCRENTSADAPERWLRVGFYSTLGGAVRRVMDDLVLQSAQAQAVKTLHDLMSVQQDGLERMTRALVGALEEVRDGKQRVEGRR